MVEPVSATGVALFGAGAWLSSRLFGPSADALGEQLKLFASSRLSKIFRKAEKGADKLDLQPVPPAFAYLFVQRASLSEDAENLSEMWANLLLSASAGYSNRHASFVEILSQIGSHEANLINTLVPEGTVAPRPIQPPVNLKSSIRERLSLRFRAVCEPTGTPKELIQKHAHERYRELSKADLGWPGFITAARYPYSDTELKNSGSIDGGSPVTSAHDILVRQRLLEFFSFDLSQSFTAPYVEGFLVTPLGLEFVLTCRGDTV